MGQLMQQAYETFQIDVGLDGSIFTRNYRKLGKLAKRSWFSHMWRLCQHFDVKLKCIHPTT